MGLHGLSGYFAEDDAAISDIVVSYLYPFLHCILVYGADALYAAGLVILPTFKAPHVTVAFGDLERGLAALSRIPRNVRQYDVQGRMVDDG